MPLSKEFLSASSGGLGIAVTATTSLGTTIHATSTMPNSKDDTWIYAQNNGSAALTVTVEMGSSSTSAQGSRIDKSVGAAEMLLMVPALPIRSTTGGTARTITMYASSSASIVAFGHVMRDST